MGLGLNQDPLDGDYGFTDRAGLTDIPLPSTNYTVVGLEGLEPSGVPLLKRMRLPISPQAHDYIRLELSR